VLGIQICKLQDRDIKHQVAFVTNHIPHNYSRNLKTRRKGSPNPTHSSPNLKPQLHSSAHHTQPTPFHQTHRGRNEREHVAGDSIEAGVAGDAGICRGEAAEAVVRRM